MADEALVLPPKARTALRAARDEQELKQPDLARRIGIDVGLLGHYETGRRPVPEARLRKWMRLLKMSDATADRFRRLSIEARIRELLADGGMAAEDRERVIWTVSHSWPESDADEAAPEVRPKKGAAGSSR